MIIQSPFPENHVAKKHGRRQKTLSQGQSFGPSPPPLNPASTLYIIRYHFSGEARTCVGRRMRDSLQKFQKLRISQFTFE